MSRTESRAVVAAERRLQALALRREGATFTEIGEALGIARSAAHKAVKRALDDLAQMAAAEVTSLRALELDRLDALQRAVWPEAMNGELGAVDRVLKISERRSRLLGLDAPAKVTATDPTGKEERPFGYLALPPVCTDLGEWLQLYAPEVRQLEDAPRVDAGH